MEHILELFVALGRNFTCSFLVLADGEAFLCSKENTIGEVHLNKVDGDEEAKVPLEELQHLSLTLDNLIISRYIGAGHAKSSLKVLLNVVDEHQLVVNLVILGRNEEACDQVDRPILWRQVCCKALHLVCLIEEESVEQLRGQMPCLSSLLEFGAQLSKPLEQADSLLQVSVGHGVLMHKGVAHLDEVVVAVADLILEHLCKELRWADVGIELL